MEEDDKKIDVELECENKEENFIWMIAVNDLKKTKTDKNCYKSTWKIQ
jgi:hypothetical protein